MPSRDVPLLAALPGALVALVLVLSAGGSATADGRTATTPSAIVGLSLSASPSYGVAPLAVQFSATLPNGSAPSLSWSFGDGSYRNGSAPALLNVSHRYSDAGTFEATLTAIWPGSTLNASVRVVVVADALSAGVSASSVDGTAPFTVTFQGSATGGATPYAGFDWTFGDGGAGVGSRVTYTFLSPGTYRTNLTVTDAAGRSASAGIGIDVGGSPLAVRVLGPPVRGAAPLTVDLTANATGGSLVYVGYAWTFGDGATGPGPTVAHTYRDPGRYVAEVRVTDSAGASATGTTVVLVDDGPLAVSPGVGSAGASGAFARQFTAAASGGSGSYDSYGWTFGDGGTAVGPTVRHTFPGAGTYDVSVTVTDSWNETFTATMAVVVPVPASLVPEVAGGIAVGTAAGVAAIALWLARSRRRRERFLATGGRPAEPASEGPPDPGASSPRGPAPVGDLPSLGRELAAGPRPVGPSVGPDSPTPGLEFPGRSTGRPAGGPLSVQRQLAFRVVHHLAHLPRTARSDPADVRATQAGIAAALGVGTSTISKVVRRLAASGMVELETTHVVGAPRRVRAYRLTPRGERLARVLDPQLPERSSPP